VSLPDAERWAQISPLLDELLDLSPQAQADWLAALQASDPALAHELDRLLQANRLAAASGLLTGDAGLTAPTEASLAGQRIGAYRLEAPIGEGGSGVVWSARRADGQSRAPWPSSCCTCHGSGARRPSAFGARARSSPG